MKNLTIFRRNRSIASQILIFLQIIEGMREKNVESTFLLVGFFKALDSIHREKMEQILLVNRFLREAVTARMLL